MLNIHPAPNGSREMTGAASGDTSAIWFDLMNGTDDERSSVERITGLYVPTMAEINEIERSSRLYTDGDAIYVSSPVVSPGNAGAPVVSSIGFVLSPRHLVSVRFAALPSFDSFAARFSKPSTVPATSIEALVELLEAMVDRLADVLEHIGAQLNHISDSVFHLDDPKGGRRIGVNGALLRRTLRSVGRMGHHASKIRDALMGVGRIVPFVVDNAEAWMPQNIHPRFDTLHQDIVSLKDYDEHLSNKVQFLLDANLGFINIEQNDIFKILTVVSIVGIPPTLLAGIYGMNFKSMPELNWTWGYAYGWAVIIISALIPLIWFRLIRWI
jgi:magnesium transporter